MITIVELPAYLARVRKILTAAEQEAVKVMIASDPTCGVVMRGTGGIRKVRFAPTGRGKSGGTRVVYYYHSNVLPAFLLTIFAKGQKDNLTTAERNELAKIVQATVETYRS
jgi:hypothetical protein